MKVHGKFTSECTSGLNPGSGRCGPATHWAYSDISMGNGRTITMCVSACEDHWIGFSVSDVIKETTTFHELTRDEVLVAQVLES